MIVHLQQNTTTDFKIISKSITDVKKIVFKYPKNDFYIQKMTFVCSTYDFQIQERNNCSQIQKEMYIISNLKLRFSKVS